MKLTCCCVKASTCAPSCSMYSGISLAVLCLFTDNDDRFTTGDKIEPEGEGNERIEVEVLLGVLKLDEAENGVKIFLEADLNEFDLLFPLISSPGVVGL